MVSLIKQWLAVGALLLIATPVDAEVVSLTLGIRMNCPYGLAGWWGNVRYGLARLEGVETISETADAAAQTCEIRMKGPGIPDPRALADHIERKMRVGATLRGIEIKAVGRLTERDDGLYLEISGTKETIRLAALRRKVQWDIPAGREQEATPAEKNAFERLRGSRKNELVLVTGPLVRPVGEEPMVLEVRSFGPAPTRRTAPPRSPSGP